MIIRFSLLLMVAAGLAGAAEIPISSSAKPTEAWAASELSRFLGDLYPTDVFPVTGASPDSGSYILLSSNAEDPVIKAHIPGEEIDEPGEFSVRKVREGGRKSETESFSFHTPPSKKFATKPWSPSKSVKACPPAKSGIPIG